MSNIGVGWVQLKKDSKRTIKGWDHCESLLRGCQDLEQFAHQLYRKNSSLGYFVRGGIWVLDLDTVPGRVEPPMLQRVEELCTKMRISPPRILTPSGGQHLIFRLPDSVDRKLLKNHVCHPREDGVVQEWDFKFGPRTLMVAPGTRNRKGVYRPLHDWVTPPVLDPRALAPELEIYRKTSEFLTDRRPKKDRICAAQNFLRTHARVSIDGRGGRKALRTVAGYLVVYRNLDPHLAHHMLTHEAPGYRSWNDRCRTVDGHTSPWSKNELLSALYNAVDDIPIAGVKAYEESVQKAYISNCVDEFVEILRRIPSHDATCKIQAADLYSNFRELFGLDLPKGYASELGTALGRAIEDHLISLIKTRIRGLSYYRGINQEILRIALDEYRRYQPLNEAC